MARLILTRGIPGSKKTTAALEWLAESPETRMRLSRDDDRLSRFGKRHGLTSKQEALITRLHMDAARYALTKGIDVIVDATHLLDWQVTPWFRIGPVSFWDFPIAIDEALRLDAEREHPVGEKAIRKFAKRVKKDGALKPAPEPPVSREYEPYEPDLTLPPAQVFDIDGTIAYIEDVEGKRSPYDYTRVSEDLPTWYVVERAAWAVQTGARLVFLSGRDDSCRAETRAWLERQLGHGRFDLHMRETGDKRDDAIVKYEMFRGAITPFYYVEAIYDDRLRVCRMWHAIGAPVFRVGDPDASF